jgi:outer membrane biosynthesis protein TonB
MADLFDDDEDKSLFQRYRVLVGLAVLVVLGAGVAYAARALSSSHQAPARQEDITMIRLPPPPPPPQQTPPPTPPPQQQPTPEQQQDPKMIEQAPVQNEKKEDAPKENKPPDAPAPLGTSITGPGGGQDLGLGSGLGGGGGEGGGGPGGTKYGWYATEVQSHIADALRSNPSTRGASMNIVVRIWPDSTGRVVKARIAGTTGDSNLDNTLRQDILTGLQLPDPPPADMPLPIVMRISAQRPQ